MHTISQSSCAAYTLGTLPGVCHRARMKIAPEKAFFGKASTLSSPRIMTNAPTSAVRVCAAAKLTAGTPLQHKRQLSEAEMDGCMRFFAETDRDCDGVISFEEALATGANEEEAKLFILECDTTGTGTVTLAEVIAAASNQDHLDGPFDMT